MTVSTQGLNAGRSLVACARHTPEAAITDTIEGIPEIRIDEAGRIYPTLQTRIGARPGRKWSAAAE